MCSKSSPVKVFTFLFLRFLRAHSLHKQKKSVLSMSTKFYENHSLLKYFRNIHALGTAYLYRRNLTAFVRSCDTKYVSANWRSGSFPQAHLD